MRLRTKDQLHISSVRADTLRPGEEFEVSDSHGEELLKAHPKLLQRVSGPSVAAVKAQPAPGNKAEFPPLNKAAFSPESKADTRRKAGDK